jgi:hypothetical protein
VAGVVIWMVVGGPAESSVAAKTTAPATSTETGDAAAAAMGATTESPSPPTPAPEPATTTEAAPEPDAAAETTGTVPAPELAPEPVPAPQPKVEVAKSPAGTADSTPPSGKPDPDGPECKRMRQRAAEARTEGEWKGVLRHTSKAACWPDATERKALRAKAYSEMMNWDECVKAGSGSSASKVKKIVAFCKARAEKEKGG